MTGTKKEWIKVGNALGMVLGGVPGEKTECDVCDVTQHYWYWLDSSESVWIHSGDVCLTPVFGQKYPKIK